MSTHASSEQSSTRAAADHLSDNELSHIRQLMEKRHVRVDRLVLELNPEECPICGSITRKFGLGSSK